MGKMLTTGYDKIDTTGRGAITVEELKTYFKTLVLTMKIRDEDEESIDSQDKEFDEYVEVAE